MLRRRRIFHGQHCDPLRQYVINPVMSIPKILRRMAVDTLNRGAVLVQQCSSANGREDDAFSKRRHNRGGCCGNFLGEESHLYTLHTLELGITSRQASENL